MTSKKHEWLDKAEYPFQSKYYEINNQSLHYIDEGKGDVLLFIHGTPSWSFDFRHIIKKLKATNRCIAIDHIGFGLSDKPENYDYSTINHSHTLEKFVDDNQLNDITLVLHDFGGPIGFNFALNHPEKIKNIIIINSWMWSSEMEPEFKKLKKILKSPLLPFLYRYLNFSPGFILPNSFGNIKITRKIHRQYLKPFGSSKERNGTIAFANSLLNDQGWFESLWQKKNTIQDKPVLLIWGMMDKVIQPKFLEKFVSGFPDAIVHKLTTCGHFPQEEEPEQVNEAIKSFLEIMENDTAN
jgi:pimeloyl-ACP methyl ester carboxylesterase